MINVEDHAAHCRMAREILIQQQQHCDTHIHAGFHHIYISSKHSRGGGAGVNNN